MGVSFRHKLKFRMSFIVLVIAYLLMSISFYYKHFKKYVQILKQFQERQFVNIKEEIIFFVIGCFIQVFETVQIFWALFQIQMQKVANIKTESLSTAPLITEFRNKGDIFIKTIQ